MILKKYYKNYELVLDYINNNIEIGRDITSLTKTVINKFNTELLFFDVSAEMLENMIEAIIVMAYYNRYKQMPRR